MTFAHPVAITLDGVETMVRDAEQAIEVLTQHWPPERGAPHRDALETCLKVVDGHRSSIDGETRLREAAREAGILAAE